MRLYKEIAIPPFFGFSVNKLTNVSFARFVSARCEIIEEKRIERNENNMISTFDFV